MEESRRDQVTPEQLQQELEAARSQLRQAQAAIRHLQADKAKLEAENQKLHTEVEELRQALVQSEKAAKRQAAPFSKNQPKTQRKKNGRKSGDQHGTHGHRPLPEEAEVDEHLEAPLPGCCPHCGGEAFEDLETVEQFQEELPRQPRRRKFTLHKGTCTKCQRRVQGRHPLQTSNATGACASQLGPDAQAAIVYLNKHAGMSYGKIRDAFESLFGISISRGGCAQVVLRAGQRLEPAAVEIQERIRTSGFLTPDESGWRVGGRPVWVHAWVGDQGATWYTIDPHRNADRLEQLIGIHWWGTMTHDGFSTYERFVDAGHQQCVDHALRRAKKLVERYPEDAAFPTRVIEILTSALKARDAFWEGKLDEDDLLRCHEDFTEDLLRLTEPEFGENEEFRTFANHLYAHGEQWFLFLTDVAIPATNHQAEQALRTPITNRKVFGGNMTDAGARAQEVTSSVLQTCKNQTISYVNYVSNALCGCVASLFA